VCHILGLIDSSSCLDSQDKAKRKEYIKQLNPDDWELKYRTKWGDWKDSRGCVKGRVATCATKAGWCTATPNVKGMLLQRTTHSRNHQDCSACKGM
jgi:hypothetical protein